MHTLQAIITGCVQGLSEFLPVSSSAHIVFSNYLYNFLTGSTGFSEANSEEIFFDIIVHLATLFAVLLYFYNDLKNICTGFFKNAKEKSYKNEEFSTVIYIILSTLVTGIFGFFLKGKAEIIIANPKYICFLLFITGLILLSSEKLYKGNKNIDLKTALIMGLAQGLAILPGFSRSGLTICAAMLKGASRTSAARFSFLMSIPVILFASLIYPILELDFSEIMTFNIKAIALGFITSFVVGYICIKYFMQILAKYNLKCFGYYCVIIAMIMISLFQFCYHI